MEKNNSLNKKLLVFKSSLPVIILADHFELRPDIANSYSEYQKEHFKKDVAWILSFLAESVWAQQPVLFEEFISWLKTFLTSVKVPMKDLTESLELMKKRINQICSPEENIIIDPLFEKAFAIVLDENYRISVPAKDNNLAPLAKRYLDNLLTGKRNDALSLIMDKVKGGVTVKEIYLQVFQPVQYEIGRLWQTNRISVGQEHFCTAATQLIMSQLYPYLFTGERKHNKLVTACVSGELHEIGARMVTDFFEMEGWDTYFLGANTPVDGVIRYLCDVKPQLMAISATMTFHVSSAEEMIRRIRTAPGIPPEMKIIVGGYPFMIAEGLWKRVGADGFAVNAEEGLLLVDKLLIA